MPVGAWVLRGWLERLGREISDGYKETVGSDGDVHHPHCGNTSSRCDDRSKVTQLNPWNICQLTDLLKSQNNKNKDDRNKHLAEHFTWGTYVKLADLVHLL